MRAIRHKSASVWRRRSLTCGIIPVKGSSGPLAGTRHRVRWQSHGFRRRLQRASEKSWTLSFGPKRI